MSLWLILSEVDRLKSLKYKKVFNTTKIWKEENLQQQN